MKTIRVILKWSGVILISFFIGIWTSQTFTKMTRVTVWSNRCVVETDLDQGLEEYHKANGHYPDSLDAVEISWLANDKERRKFLLKPFYYENRGTTYLLWWPRTEL